MTKLKIMVKKIFHSHSFVLLFLLIFLISLLTSARESLPNTYTLYGKTSLITQPSKLDLLYLGGNVKGKHVTIEIHGIYSPIRIYLYREISFDNINSITPPLLITTLTATTDESISYSIQSKQEFLGLRVISLYNLTFSYEVRITWFGIPSTSLYANISLFIISLIAFSVTIFIQKTTKKLQRQQSYTIEGLRQSLLASKPSRLALYKYELSTYNYALYTILVLLLSSFDLGSYLIPNYNFSASPPSLDRTSSFLLQYVQGFILYQPRMNFLVIFIGTLGLLYSKIKDGQEKKDLHILNLYPSKFGYILWKTLALTTVLGLTWFMTVGYLVGLYASRSPFYYHPVLILVFLSVLLTIFLFSLYYYSLEIWVPPKLRWYLPLFLYLVFFRIDFLFSGTGIFLLPYSLATNSATSNITNFVVSLTTVFVSGVIVSFALVITRERTDPNQFQLYTFFS